MITKTHRCAKCLIYYQVELDERRINRDTHKPWCRICNPDTTLTNEDKLSLIRKSLRIEARKDKRGAKIGMRMTYKTKSKRYELLEA